MKLHTETEKTNRLLELEQELIQARNYVNEQDELYYKNNDWNSASESPIKRVLIEMSAWRNDADEVEHVHHGVKINGRYIVSMNNKWSDKFKKWYPYNNIDKLFAGILA